MKNILRFSYSGWSRKNTRSDTHMNKHAGIYLKIFTDTYIQVSMCFIVKNLALAMMENAYVFNFSNFPKEWNNFCFIR